MSWCTSPNLWRGSNIRSAVVSKQTPLNVGSAYLSDPWKSTSRLFMHPIYLAATLIYSAPPGWIILTPMWFGALLVVGSNRFESLDLEKIIHPWHKFDSYPKHRITPVLSRLPFPGERWLSGLAQKEQNSSNRTFWLQACENSWGEVERIIRRHWSLLLIFLC